MRENTPGVFSLTSPRPLPPVKNRLAREARAGHWLGGGGGVLFLGWWTTLVVCCHRDFGQSPGSGQIKLSGPGILVRALKSLSSFVYQRPCMFQHAACTPGLPDEVK